MWCNFVVLALITQFFNSDAATINWIKRPIILVNGLGGVQMEMRNVSESLEWKVVWINVNMMFSEEYGEEFLRKASLVYDEDSQTTHNQPGIEMRPVDFGGVTGLEYLTDLVLFRVGYYSKIIDFLQKRGYTVGKDLFGAPYDFRKAPNELGEYYQQLESLIEQAKNNTNDSVKLICHSNGCPALLYFLNNKDIEWKSQHVHSLVSISAPWAGCVKALKTLVAGIILPLKFKQSSLRGFFRTLPSLFYNLPSPKVWGKEEILVNFNGKKYSAHDYESLFHELDKIYGTNMFNLYNATRELKENLKAPNVMVECLYTNSDNSTLESFIYIMSNLTEGKDQDFDGPGDQTVNHRSLEYCQHWKDEQEEEVVLHRMDNSDHHSILFKESALDVLIQHN